MIKEDETGINERLDRIEASLDQIVGQLNSVPDMLAIGTNTMDEMAGRAEDLGIESHNRIAAGLKLLLKLSEPQTIAALEGLIDLSNQLPGLMAMGVDTVDDIVRESPFLTEENLEFLKKTLTAVSEANGETPPKVGPFGLLGALRDSDRQKALGHLMNILKKLGKNL